jgi:hypothetical protein
VNDKMTSKSKEIILDLDNLWIETKERVSHLEEKGRIQDEQLASIRNQQLDLSQPTIDLRERIREFIRTKRESNVVPKDFFESDEPGNW